MEAKVLLNTITTFELKLLLRKKNLIKYATTFYTTTLFKHWKVVQTFALCLHKTSRDTTRVFDRRKGGLVMYGFVKAVRFNYKCKIYKAVF